jgi:hypothetical protein
MVPLRNFRLGLVHFWLVQLVMSLDHCPDGTLPLCRLQTGSLCPDGSQPHCLNSGKNPTVNTTCPTPCNPHSNRCDPTTAPTCIFPDPRAASPRAACACRPGYKAKGYASNDITKQWRLPIEGQNHRVWVSENVECDVLCDVSTGVASCREVTVIAQECTANASDREDSLLPLYQPFPPDIPITFANTTSLIDPVSTYVNTTSVVAFQNSSTLTTYQFNDSKIFGNTLISIPVLLPANSTFQNQTNTTVLLEINSNGIEYALPRILSQFGISDEDINAMLGEAVPALTAVALGLFNTLGVVNQTTNQTIHQNNPLPGRGLTLPKIGGSLGQIGEAAKKLVIKTIPKKIVEGVQKISKKNGLCTIIASSTLIGFMAEAEAVYSRAPGPGIPITKQQMFFLYPVYGDFPITERLRIHYGFDKSFIENFGAITFGRHMYLTDNAALSGPPWGASRVFSRATETLIHEVRHTLQYQSHRWSKQSFGLEYLLQYCQSGYTYSKIPYEQDAFAYGYLMTDFLDNEFGYSFYEFWKAKKLHSTLGYPTGRTWIESPGSSSGPGNYELKFQKGVLQGFSRGDCNRCFRVLDERAVLYRHFSDACYVNKNPANWCPIMHQQWEETQKEKPICLPSLQRQRNAKGYCSSLRT